MDLTAGQQYLESKGLNKNQMEAVMDFSHDLLILSTAGSGKTRVITEKIAFALNYMGYKPSQILALTFTRKAAEEMRKRVKGLCKGSDNLDDLTISTFHSYGMNLIESFIPVEYELLDDKDQLNFVQSIANVKRREAEDIADLISMAKDNEIFPWNSEEVRAIAEKAAIQNFPEIYEEYERELEKNNLLDFEDLILKAMELLDENAKVREKLHGKYRLILVDEYQDTNSMQDKFLKKLKGPQCQLMIVGDDDQGIYGFRGAKVENIRRYHLNKGVYTIPLGCNYRSNGAILDFAKAIIEQSSDRISKTIITENEYGEKPYIFSAHDPDEEIYSVIDIIMQDPQMDTAILARTNAKVNRFIYPLLESNLDVDISDSISYLLRNDTIKKTFYGLQLLENSKDEEAFGSFINGMDDVISDNDAETICMHADDLDFIIGIENALREGKLSAPCASWAPYFLECFNNARKIKDKRHSYEFENAVTGMVLGKGFLSDPKKSGKIGNISDFLSLRKTCLVESDSTKLRDFISALMPSSDDGKKRNAKKNIRLLTIHKAKGLEFDRVFIVDVNDDVLPLEKAETKEEIEEERKLFYVAATRAKKLLYVSYVEEDSKGNESIPSMFLQNIDPSLYNGSLDTYHDADFSDDISWAAEAPSSDYLKKGDIVITEKGERAIVTGVGSKIRIRVFSLGNEYAYDSDQASRNLVKL